MTTITEVRFREVGKVYSFAPGELELKRGDHVVVETSRGTEYGTVVMGNHDAEDEKVPKPLKQILRKATPEDDRTVAENAEKEKEAFKLCKQKIAEHNMEMKLIAAEYAFDNSKILFYFTADGRIDFRDLVKDLASVFKNRIELRQVGVRDETKIVGGMGSCGRSLCCHSYLTDFVPVSIRMAKEQNLSLNPQKISGVCGRLMCCLKNEAETYAFLNKTLPKKGDTMECSDGLRGEVTEIDVLRQRVKIQVIKDNDEREIREVPAEELTFICHRKKGQPSQPKKKPGTEKERKPEAEKKPETEEKPGTDRKPAADRKPGTDRRPVTDRRSATDRKPEAVRERRPLREERKAGLPEEKPGRSTAGRAINPIRHTEDKNPVPGNQKDGLQKPKRQRHRHHGHRNQNQNQNQTETGRTAGRPAEKQSEDHSES